MSVPGVVRFPAALDDAVSLIEAKNRAGTTLTGSFNAATDPEMNVASTSTFAATGIVTVGDNRVRYTAKTATKFTGCSFVADGATATTHSSGAVVEQRMTALHHTTLVQAIREIQAVVGINGENIEAGSGDIVGPASAIDNALARYDGPTGKVLQSSLATLSDAGALVASLRDKGGGWHDVKAYGAIGDGVAHPLSEFYGTLVAAQAVYPQATALTNTIDWAATAKATAAATAAGGGTVFFPSGRYVLNKRVDITDRIQIRGVIDAVADLEDQSRSQGFTVDTPDTALAATSILIIDHGKDTATTAGNFSPNVSAAAFGFRGVAPSLVGVLIYYRDQMRPYRRWAAGAEWSPAQFRTPPSGTANPQKVVRIQATGTNNGIWELDRINPGASSVGGYTSHASDEPDWPTPGAGVQIQDNEVWWKSVPATDGTYSQGSAPHVYPPTFYADTAAPPNVIGAQIRNVVVLNAYELLRFDEGNNLTILENLWFSAFRRGIYIDRAVGQPYIYKCRNMSLINMAFGEGDNDGMDTSDWISAYLESLVLGETDWVRVLDYFVHRCKDGVRLVDGVSGGSDDRPRGVFYGFGAESVSRTAIRAETTNPSEGVVFVSPNVSVEAAGTAAIHLASGSAYEPMVRVIYGTFAAEDLPRHVYQQSGRLHVIGTQFPRRAATANVQIAAGAKEFHMAHAVFDGTGVGLSIANALTARVFLTANDLKATTYTPPASLPTTYRAVANVGIPDAGITSSPAYHKHGSLTVTFVEGGSAVTWNDMPSAQTNFQGVDRWRARVDLAQMTEVRLTAHVLVAGATGAKLRIRYSTDDAAFTSFAACECPIDTTGTKTSGWATLTSGLIVDNLVVQLTGIAGDGAADPQFAMIRAEFR